MQPPLISSKRDKNIENFLVRSSFQTNDQSGTFKCARSRRKTCPFIHNVEKTSGPKRSIKITDHFTCISANVIYRITCTYCNKLYIDETGRRLGDRFRALATWREKERTYPNQSLDTLISQSFKTAYASLRPFLTCRQFGKPQNTRAKIYVPNRHP